MKYWPIPASVVSNSLRLSLCGVIKVSGGCREVSPEQTVAEVWKILVGLKNALKYLKESLKSVECKRKVLGGL